MKPLLQSLINWLLLAPLFIQLVRPGHISPWDLEVDYLNVGLTTNYKLYFTLENALPQYQFARIVWPYDLGFTTAWTDTAQWGRVSGRCSDPDISFLAQVRRSALAADASLYVYYIRFTSGTAGTYGTLAAQQPYLLTITAPNTPTSSGTYGPIEFYTVSSSGAAADTNYIIYDANPIFNYIYVTPAASSTLTATFSSTATTKNDIAAKNYPVIIDLTTTIEIKSAFRLAFESTSTDFTFVEGTCYNLAATGAPLLTSGFQATYTSSRVLISVNEALTAGRKLRFQCGIKNPNYVSTGGLKFKTMWLDAPNVIEMTTVSTGLSTQTWTWGTAATPNANLKIYLGWGIDFTTNTNLPDCFKIYKSLSGHYIYNTIKFELTPSQSTPTGLEILLTLQTYASTNFVIIPSTMTENLPDVKGGKVSCAIDATTNIITCSKVGPLSNTMKYFISFKFYIKSGASDPDLGSNFGMLTVTDTLGNSIVAAAKSAISDNNIYTNSDIFPPSIGDSTDTTNFRADNLVHSFRTVDAVASSSNTVYGMFAPAVITDTMELSFRQYWQGSDVSSSPATGDGVEYFTTPAVVPLASQVNLLTSPVCTGDTAGVLFDVCEASLIGSVVTSPGRHYTRIRFSPTTANFGTQFPGSKTATRLRMPNLQITKPSGLFFMDDGVYDFYGRGVAATMTVANLGLVDIAGTTSRFLFNSYVVSKGALSNMNFGISMFWADATTNLDGSTFPAYIRILGYLTTAERSKLQRLAIFFNGLDVFTEADGTVPCAANVRSLTCYGKTGHAVSSYNPLVLNRVIVDVSPLKQGDSNVNRMQIIIPVKTVTNFLSIDMAMATLTDQSYFFSDKNYFKTTYLKVKKRVTYSGLAAFASYSSTTYRIAFTDTPMIGATSSGVTLSNSIALAPNEDPDVVASPLVYGAMSYCAPWAWNTHSSFSITPIPNTVTNLYTCSKVSFLVSGTRHYCSYCPIQTTLTTTSTSQTTQNFILPYQLGQAVPNAYQSFSFYDGTLSQYGLDSRATILNIPSTIKSMVLTGSPPILYSGYKNYQLSFTFSSSVGIPQNGYIEITTTDTSFGFSLTAPTTATFDGTTCSIATFTATKFQCLLAHTKDFSAGTHNLTVKAADINSVVNDFTFGVNSYTNGLKAIEKSSGSGTYKVRATPGYTLEASDVALNTTNYGAVTWFSFKVKPSKVKVFSNEQFVFDLGNDFKSAQGSRSVYCYVKEGLSLSYKFKSCDISNLNSLTLTPRWDFWRNDAVNDGYLTVFLSNVLTPSSAVSTTLSGNLQRSGTTVQAIATPLTFPTLQAATAISALSLVKKHNQAGSILQLEFSYTPGVTLTNAHSIYIQFPTYYSSRLGYNSTYCTIDGDPVYCLCSVERTLHIRWFIKDYASGTAHTIKIFGVRNPYSSTASTIFFGVDNDEDPSTYVEQGTVTDVLPSSSTITALVIYNVTVSTTQFRVASTYTVRIQTGSSTISSGNIMTIDFPDKYGNYLTVPEYFPTCSLQKSPADGTSYGSTCTTFGSRIKLPITTGLAANSEYILILTGIRNPDDILCKLNKLRVSVLDSTEVNLLYRSIAPYANCKFFTYTSNSLLDTLSWTLNGGIVASNTEIQLPRGVFSNELCLISTSDKIKETFDVSLSTTEALNYSMIPTSPLHLGTGMSYSCMRIAATQNTPTTVYDIKFLKDEPLPANFTDVPRLRVHLLDVEVEIGLPETAYDVIVGGISLPMIFDLQNFPPKSDITIEAVLSNTDDFAFLETETITITNETHIGYFFIKAVDGAAVGATGTLSFTLSGTDKDSYTITTPSITLTIQTAPITAFEYTVTATSVKQATYQEFEAIANQPSVIYWGIIMQNTFDRPCDYIKDNALTFFKYKTLDYAQEQFGFVMLTVSQLNTKFTVYNLRSKQNYDIVFCGESLAEKTSDQTISFAAYDKNVQVVSATFKFDAALSTQQEIDFGCFLASEFRLLEYNVINNNRVSCYDKYPDVDLPTRYDTPPYVYDPAAVDTSSLTYSPPTTTSTSSRRRLSQTPDFLPATSSSYSIGRGRGGAGKIGAQKVESSLGANRLLQTDVISTSDTLTYIFYEDAQTEAAVTIDSKIRARLLVLDTTARPTDFSFKSQLAIFKAGYTGGFPNLISGEYNGLINLITPAFAAFPVITVTRDIEWVAMKNVKLESSGFVYAVAVFSNATAPNTIQVRHGLDGDDSPAITTMMVAIADDEIITMNFTGLKNYTDYTLYYYATNEDISRFALTTTISKITLTTMMAEPVEVYGAIMKTSWFLLALIISYVI